ncbi:MAG: 50S ribosomal protein L9, partial [Chloroflexi bacterium]|nr:50S ribosomal protein L9 [Chloroflexota bacterium]
CKMESAAHVRRFICLWRMAVQIKVLLTKDVEQLGKAGELKRVARGYARNYLFPRGLATVPTEGAMRQVEIISKAEAKRGAKLSADARATAEKMSATPLEFTAKVGEQGRLYGSITSQDIADALSQKLGAEVDRRKIELAEPLKQVGEHTVNVRLYGDVAANVKVTITPEAEA